MQLPSGFRAVRAGGANLYARDADVDFLAAALARHGTLAAWAAAHATAVRQGRTTAYVIDAPERRWLVRHATRGGRVARVLHDRYLRLGTPRPLRELRVSVRARSLGIDTPEVVACAVYPSGAFYRADIATEYIEDAVELAALGFGSLARPEHERAEAWRVSGRLIAAAAATGFVHPDLNLRNIVVTWSAGAARAHLLDLDRARFAARPSPRDLTAMLRRIERSIRKFERNSGQPLGPAERAAFRDGLAT